MENLEILCGIYRGVVSQILAENQSPSMNACYVPDTVLEAEEFGSEKKIPAFMKLTFGCREGD